MKIQSVRGMNDILAPDIELWRAAEKVICDVFRKYGYSEIRTPILESTDLFCRGVGDQTDIVQKEMYTFEDRNGDSLTLRPEGTASVVRAVVEKNVLRANPIYKCFYLGPMFRHERPQKGRYRQFYQFGAELFGVENSLADVETIVVQQRIYEELGLKDIRLELSSVGCPNCRPPYIEKLKELLRPVKEELPKEFQPRIENNPLRVFDQKDEASKKISSKLPFMLDSLCETCANHFESVKKGLQDISVNFDVNPKIVRGLDYYVQTAFEFIGGALGAQSTLSGGGRYDGLVESLGGTAAPGVGFAGGMERLIISLENSKFQVPKDFLIAIVYHGELAGTLALKLSEKLRKQGHRVHIDLQMKSMKAQFKRADKEGASLSLVIGEKEVSDGSIVVKDMLESTQNTISLDVLDDTIKSVLKNKGMPV